MRRNNAEQIGDVIRFFLRQQGHLHRLSGDFAQSFFNQVYVFVLDQGDHALHFHDEKQNIVLQDAGNQIAVNPRVVGHVGHFPRQKGAGLVPERLHVHSAIPPKRS